MDVFCAIDGKQWDALDPGVRFVHGDGRWECASMRWRALTGGPPSRCRKG